MANSPSPAPRTPTRTPTKLADRRYALRAQLRPANDSTLDGGFRIYVTPGEMKDESLTPGDLVLLRSEITHAGGVGIAWRSTDPNAGGPKSTTVLKVHSVLRECAALDLKDRYVLTKWKGRLRRARRVVLVDITPDAAPIADEDERGMLEHWAGVTLLQLEALGPGGTLDVTPRAGPDKRKKRRFVIAHIDVADVDDDPFFVPSYYHHLSKVEIRAAATDTGTAAPGNDARVPVSLDFAGLKGLDDQLATLREHIARVNMALDSRATDRRLGRPSAILLHGASGTGKSAVLAKLKAGPWAHIVTIDRKILSPYAGKAETAISKLFTEAAACTPSLVVIDRLEGLAGSKAESTAVAEELAAQIQRVEGTAVQVVAAAKRPIDVDADLLSVFPMVIELPIPNSRSRMAMLREFTDSAPEEVLLDVAERTHAFVASDLFRLCDKAYTHAQKRVREGGIAETMAGLTLNDTIQLTGPDFDHALLHVHPSVMNEAYIEIPKVYWRDIAGSTDVKTKLWETVELPLKHPRITSHLNLHPSAGILLYGPPGCSKTLTAKALATESGLNFLSIKGPELITKYVGESEYRIRELFRRARSAAPSVIFFDEIDALAPARGDGHTGLNTVATLLTELDGIDAVPGVLVLAATNRPGAIDPALLRPGRLGTALFVGPPGPAARRQILEMHTKARHPGPDVDLDVLAERTEGYSGADVAAVCQAAAVKCAHDMVRDEGVEMLGMRHFEEALGEFRPSLAREEVERLRRWSVAGGFKDVEDEEG
ncbi:AAA-domain-containing protein [Trichodelitschia bisporula]|uniref:AAA-domain-containing protein n=1 Tax=Trichodelitschia bisporula TaxID=703511 RepID=A0A6G1HS07_9PEZI|nr:AAA-domain-containing protein [Trichodelitschia bisporula]